LNTHTAYVYLISVGLVMGMMG